MSPNQFDAEMVEVKKDAQLGCKEILDHLSNVCLICLNSAHMGLRKADCQCEVCQGQEERMNNLSKL